MEDEGDDVAVCSAIVRLLPRLGGSAMHKIEILRAISLPGLRQTALEALDKMGSLT